MKYLCEIGCEEIPARFINNLILDCYKKTQLALTKNRLEFTDIKIYATYRRLAIFINGLSEKQADLETEIKGPPKKIACDIDGHFTKSAFGFAKKYNLTEKDLFFKKIDNQEYIFANVFEKGKKTEVVLADIIKNIINSLDKPISMKWGKGEFEFIRPVHWILSLLDNKVLPFSLFGIKAGSNSYGHRFLTLNKYKQEMASGIVFKIKEISQYKKILKTNYVIVDQEERKAIIRKKLNINNIEEKLDESLLEEVTYLTEFPQILEVEFNEKYLKLPSEVLVQCVKKNQKVFSIWDKNKLTNKCAVIVENLTSKSKKNIKIGNKEVITARLEDAKFFWEEDKAKKLEDFVQKLKGIIFQKNMGTLYDKTIRNVNLAKYLSKTLGFQKKDQKIELATYLSKADLASQMVFELPALQGIMGALYAKEQGIDSDISQAIAEHYLPRFSGDNLPSGDISIVVSLADKMDTIVSCFQNGMIPTGSQDPLSIRRLGIGVITICIEKKLDFSILDFMNQSYALITKEIKNKDKLLSFFEQRIKTYLLDKKIPYDIATATINGFDNPYRIFKISQALNNYRQDNAHQFKLITESAVRVKRLAKNVKNTKINEKLFVEDIEKIIFDKYQNIVKTLKENMQKYKYTAVLNNLAELADSIALYFEKILVMDKDNLIKNNRLAFIDNLNYIFHLIADFELIVNG